MASEALVKRDREGQSAERKEGQGGIPCREIGDVKEGEDLGRRCKGREVERERELKGEEKGDCRASKRAFASRGWRGRSLDYAWLGFDMKVSFELDGSMGGDVEDLQ